MIEKRYKNMAFVLPGLSPSILHVHVCGVGFIIMPFLCMLCGDGCTYTLCTFICREELVQCREQEHKLEDEIEYTEEKIRQKKGIGSR